MDQLRAVGPVIDDEVLAALAVVGGTEAQGGQEAPAVVYARGRLAEQRKERAAMAGGAAQGSVTSTSKLTAGAGAYDGGKLAAPFGSAPMPGMARGGAGIPQYTQQQMHQYMQQQIRQLEQMQRAQFGSGPSPYGAGAPASAPARDTTFDEAEWRFANVVDPVTGASRPIPTVTYVTDASDTGIEIWLEEHVTPSCEVLGFDVTWRPSRDPVEGQIALLQLATNNAILVVHLAHMKSSDITDALRDVLYARRPLLVGYGATRHAERLARCCQMQCSGTVDIGDATGGLRRRAQGTPGSRSSLSELANEYLGTTTTAAPADFSDRLWERTPLSRIERWFAAEGAWVSIAIYAALCARWGAATVLDVAQYEASVNFRSSSSPVPPGATSNAVGRRATPPSFGGTASWTSLPSPSSDMGAVGGPIAPSLPSVEMYSGNPTWTTEQRRTETPKNPPPLW